MKKIVISILMVLLMSVAMMGSSYAAQLAATIEITPSVTEVSAGDKVVFTFVIKDVANALDDSIGGIEGIVNYNENFFELVTGAMNTSFTSGGESGERFNVLSVAEEGDTIAILTLKVKDNPTGSGIVEFTELAASDGDVDRGDEAIATTADQTFTITLKSATSTDPETPTDPSTPTDPDTPVNPEEPSGNGDSTQTPGQSQPTTDGTTVVVGGDSTVADKDIPKAGINAIILIAVIAISIVAIIMYKKNQSFKDIK